MTELSDERVKALKTICGAVQYTFKTYGEREIPDYEWRFICGYLNLDVATVYSLEIFNNGFLLTTQRLAFRYHHHAMHSERKIEIS